MLALVAAFGQRSARVWFNRFQYSVALAWGMSCHILGQKLMGATGFLAVTSSPLPLVNSSKSSGALAAGGRVFAHGFRRYGLIFRVLSFGVLRRPDVGGDH